VALPLITKVKVQPHSLEFYDAVQRCGDVLPVLQQSLARYTALTEETSVPVQILDETYNVQIVSLEPLAAVRIKDQAVDRDFAFRVEFEAAPALEDEEAKLERQKALIEAYKAQQAERDAAAQEERMSLVGRRDEAKMKHFEALRERLTALSGAGGDMEVALRLPGGGGQVRVNCCEGAPVGVLIAQVLQSKWAEEATPWSVTLLMNLPRRELTEADTMTKDMHHCVMTVQEHQAPEKDEELFAAVDDAPPLGREVSKEEVQASFEVKLPVLDEAKLMKQTQRAFEIQRFIQAGATPEEAEAKVDRGDRAPADAKRAVPKSAPAPEAPVVPEPAAPAPPAPQEERPPELGEPGHTELARPLDCDEEYYLAYKEVVDFTGCTPLAARWLLPRRGWNREAVINEILDQY